MKLPNLSYMMTVGELRYIQAHFETPAYRNPDFLVGMFLPFSERCRAILRGTVFLSRMRAKPLYAYVIARTRYYDEVFLKAALGGARSIVNIGSGSDTRAYRFAHILQKSGVSVLECDQAAAIEAKRQVAAQRWPADHVKHLPLDLNLDQGGWPGLVQHLDANAGAPLLVMLEGVSPYVNASAFTAFLRLLARKLHPASVVAYDFKLAGVADDFGRANGSERLFRLTADPAAVADFHRPLGLDVKEMQLGSAMQRRLLPGAPVVFEEDCLLQLVIRPRAAASA